jgi:hypothetical protein
MRRHIASAKNTFINALNQIDEELSSGD